MEKKNIWFFHHYAVPPNIPGLTRPYDFAKSLQKQGVSCEIFTSSYLHYGGYNISKDKSLVTEIIEEDVRFNFIKTNSYQGNKISRVRNMVMFAFNLIRATKKCDVEEKPDVIIASSPHPLTCISGLIVARRYNIPCIVEIRDLWPESFVSYGILSKKNPILKLLYKGERWIYKKADKIIFTMEGGKDYIVEKGWNKENGGPIALKKIYHINNGIDIDVFNYNKKNYTIEDKDLEDKDIIKIVYTGSIRKVNNLGLIVETARNITDPQIKFLIWGDGDERVKLEEKCKQEGVENVIFKGAVEKKYIPYILSNADINFLHGQYTPIMEYGMSANKLFDYIAAQKPILSDLKTNYDIILKYKLGVVTQGQSPEDIRDGIQDICNMNLEEKHDMNENFIEAKKEYDYKSLTNKLIEII